MKPSNTRSRLTMATSLSFFGALALVFVAHCGDDTCIRNSDCASNEMCTMGHCGVVVNEAGALDTGTFETGTSGDTGASDSAAYDSSADASVDGEIADAANEAAADASGDADSGAL